MKRKLRKMRRRIMRRNDENALELGEHVGEDPYYDYEPSLKRKKVWWQMRVERRREILYTRKAHQKGFATELRVLDSFIVPSNIVSSHNSKWRFGYSVPEWFVGFEKATKAQDAEGIDFILRTTNGDVYLQVKSSEGGKDAFLREHPSHQIRSLFLRHTSGAKASQERSLVRRREAKGRCLIAMAHFYF
jgi:hypothetical protein